MSALVRSDCSVEGNPIYTPGLNEQVPAGKPYSITWSPTTPGPVTLHLLRGPTENNVPIATIASSIPNSGSYQWTPPLTLENDITHYGISLTVDGTSTCQYTTQFGISNPGGPSPGSGSSLTTSTSGAAPTATGSTTHISTTPTSSSSLVIYSSANATAPATSLVQSSATIVTSTSSKAANGTAITATASKPTGGSTSSAPATASKSAAGRVKLGTTSLFILTILSVFVSA